MKNTNEEYHWKLEDCYEMKCIIRGSSKFIQPFIVGKYGISSICSARTIREILPRFYHEFADIAIIGFYFTQYPII